MSQNQQELEIKLYLQDLAAFKGRVETFGGELTEPRLHEVPWS